MKTINLKTAIAMFSSVILLSLSGCGGTTGDSSDSQLVGSSPSDDAANRAPVAVSPGDQVIILETEKVEEFFTRPTKTSQKSTTINEKDTAIRMMPPSAPLENESVVKAVEIYLDASRSYDPDGDSLTYYWTLISKPERSTLDLSTITSAEDAIEEVVLGDYVFGLVVSDGELSSPQITFKVSLKVFKVEMISVTDSLQLGKTSIAEKGTNVQEAGSFFGDGNLTYTYNEYGDVLTEVANFMYSGTYKKANTYDSKGNRLTQELDYNNDDSVEEKYFYTYDANGNRITEELDYDNDGSVDQKNTYTYDSNGNRLTEAFDYSNDGTVNQKNTYTYDANGNRLTEAFDYDNDGTANQKNTYTYDANGNRLTEEFDWDNDGTADQKYTYTYDTNGNRLTEEYDYNNDGTIDSKISYAYTYDANGNILTSDLDYGDDGMVDETITFTYDVNGNEIKRDTYDAYMDLLVSTENRNWILLP